jgi:hypothetical protein
VRSPITVEELEQIEIEEGAIVALDLMVESMAPLEAIGIRCAAAEHRRAA